MVLLYLLPARVCAQDQVKAIQFDFYGDSIQMQVDMPIVQKQNTITTIQSVNDYYNILSNTNYQPLIDTLLFFKEKYNLDDWLYYQLIRNTAEQVVAKHKNYEYYTLCKWFLLAQSGYATTLKINNGCLLFYIQTNDEIFNLPYYTRGGKQFVCLNYHDYPVINFDNTFFTEINLIDPADKRAFTYRVTQLPNFNPKDYIEKDLKFNYYENEYHFKIKLNQQIKTIFNNYPVVDYKYYFNIPLSKETYLSLIPLLKKDIKGMNTKNGVDFLMRFTRYAFLFETDTKVFGQEKRLSPEQTLLFEQSDCEDRAALFFFLVKEIYNLPMIVLSFPNHVTIAVKFDKPIGKPILYNGSKYSVCEPTPQREDLNIGRLLPELKTSSYEVVYAYSPH